MEAKSFLWNQSKPTPPNRSANKQLRPPPPPSSAQQIAGPAHRAPPGKGEPMSYPTMNSAQWKKTQTPLTVKDLDPTSKTTTTTTRGASTTPPITTPSKAAGKQTNALPQPAHPLTKQALSPLPGSSSHFLTHPSRLRTNIRLRDEQGGIRGSCRTVS